MFSRLSCCALGLALACGFSQSARAEIHIEGDQASTRVTTDQNTISDVLSALAANFRLEYRSAIPLNELANETYSGSLNQVIARLLDGDNFLIKREGETTEILVFGKRGDKLAAPPPRKPPPEKTVRSLWQ
jgi:hypothetical protein